MSNRRTKNLKYRSLLNVSSTRLFEKRLANFEIQDFLFCGSTFNLSEHIPNSIEKPTVFFFRFGLKIGHIL